MALDRRDFLGYAGIGAASLLVRPLFAQAAPTPTLELEELTIAQMQRYSSRALVEAYLARIDAIDKKGPAINSIIELNPDALSIADALDAERKAKGPRGPLHGIPILIKDNIDTADRMHTSAGSLALADSIAPRDSHVAQRLREAGAVILGKTNLSEWANFRSTHSTSGWSGRGGQTHNPYALDRNPCGSSAGTGAAIAANLAAIGIGSETDGSVVCPSSACGLVGIKPTLGLISRAGIIPIAHSQDTAGPMCRTVTDTAILLGVLAGADDLQLPAGRARHGLHLRIDARQKPRFPSRFRGLLERECVLDQGRLAPSAGEERQPDGKSECEARRNGDVRIACHRRRG